MEEFEKIKALLMLPEDMEEERWDSTKQDCRYLGKNDQSIKLFVKNRKTLLFLNSQVTSCSAFAVASGACQARLRTWSGRWRTC